MDADAFDQVRSTPPGQAAPSPALMQNEPEKYDDSKVSFLNRKCFDFWTFFKSVIEIICILGAVGIVSHKNQGK